MPGAVTMDPIDTTTADTSLGRPCPYCKTRVNATSIYCPNCGQVVA